MDILISRITVNENICHGKAIIRGLRYPVQITFELTLSKTIIEEFLEDHPNLVKENFIACLVFAARRTEVKGIRKVALA
jgi:uncharacterized protein (DUF433 family)